jgi:hypothetical protein
MQNENDLRVKESIEIGSIFESLFYKLVTIEEILRYLLIHPVNNKTMIAYKAVCTFDRTQIVDDIPFILQTSVDEYIVIYMLYFGKDHIMGRNDSESINIARKTTNLIIKMSTLSDWTRSIQMLCDINHRRLNVLSTDRDLIIGGRCTNYIQDLIRSGRNISVHDFITNDYLDILKRFKYSEYEDLLLVRCRYLKDKAPTYWNKVGHEIYSNLISNNINTKSPVFSRIKLEKYVALFPTLFNSDILNMSPLIYNLNLLPMVIQAYVLGFSLNVCMPGKTLIDEAIILLRDQGIDNYVKNITEKNKLYLSNHNDMVMPFNDKKYLIGNTQDSLYEEPYMYNLFDVVKLYNDTHVYFFTRPEFPSLIERKINTWSNLEIPYAAIQEINSRYVTANKYNLPKSDTIYELLKQVEENKLYKENPTNISEAPMDPNEISISQFLTHALFNQTLQTTSGNTNSMPLNFPRIHNHGRVLQIPANLMNSLYMNRNRQPDLPAGTLPEALPEGWPLPMEISSILPTQSFDDGEDDDDEEEEEYESDSG